jgi:acetyltransferase
MEEDAAHQMGKMVKKRGKPIVVHSLYDSEKPHSLELLRYYDIPVFGSLDVACKSISVLAEYGSFLRSYHAKGNFVINWGAKAKKEGKAIIQNALDQNRTCLLEPEAKALLRLHGAPVLEEFLAKTAKEAVAFGKKLRAKKALKIVSPDILHKSDAGGVILNLGNEKEIRCAYKQLMVNAKEYNPGADIRGILVSPMAEDGVEVIIGTQLDDQFGPVIMYGLGGIMVEVLKDVAFRVLPITRLSAKQLIEETQSSPILNGIRGNPPYDKNALVKLLLLCSEIIESYPRIKEMDLNPVVVHEKGLSLVDARIILR